MTLFAHIFAWLRPRRETPEERLERLVRETRESYEIRRYREKRAAALKHTRA